MQSIFPPSLGAIVELAHGFDEAQFDEIASVISQPSSTDPSDADVEALSGKLGITEDELRYFLSFLTFLFVQTQEVDAHDLPAALGEFLREHGKLEDPSHLAEQLSKLLEYRAEQSMASTRQRLMQGALPNLTFASSFVDLRTVFGRDSDGELDGNVGEKIPVIQLVMRTNSSKDFEREFILQLDETSLSNLKEVLSEIEMKIEILKRAN